MGVVSSLLEVGTVMVMSTEEKQPHRPLQTINSNWMVTSVQLVALWGVMGKEAVMATK